MLRSSTQRNSSRLRINAGKITGKGKSRNPKKVAIVMLPIVSCSWSEEDEEFFDSYPAYELDNFEDHSAEIAELRKSKDEIKKKQKKQRETEIMLLTAASFAVLTVLSVLFFYSDFLLKSFVIPSLNNWKAIFPIALFGITCTRYFKELRQKFYTYVYEKTKKSLVLIQIVFLLSKYLLLVTGIMLLLK